MRFLSIAWSTVPADIDTLRKNKCFDKNGLTVVGVGNDVERVDVSWTQIHDDD